MVTPTVRRELSPRNIVRLYSFQDLLELMVAAELVAMPDISTQHVRSLLERLRSRGVKKPLSELRFAVSGREILFQDADGNWEGSRKPNQFVEARVLKLRPIEARLRKLVRRGRPGESQGRVVKRRKVRGSQPVFAGTRVPVEAVLDYLAAGKTARQIRRAFPRLTDADIEKAKVLAAAAAELRSGRSADEVRAEFPNLSSEEIVSAREITVVA